MSQIYKRAAHVLTYMGPHANVSEAFLNQLINMKKLLHSIYSSIDPDCVDRDSWFVDCEIQNYRRLPVWCYMAANFSFR